MLKEKTAGIICEYNPFHLGHQKQINMIRQKMGEDCAIVCLMSGNFVQRGMPAIFDKSFRSRAAIDCGADLVLELPVTVFRFAGLDFATIPGELYSTLQPEGLSVITYANGYFRDICPESAYENSHYEALAAITARGEGEHLIEQIRQLTEQNKRR